MKTFTSDAPSASSYEKRPNMGLKSFKKLSWFAKHGQACMPSAAVANETYDTRFAQALSVSAHGCFDLFHFWLDMSLTTNSSCA
jgi:hypothetical protein